MNRNAVFGVLTAAFSLGTVALTITAYHGWAVAFAVFTLVCITLAGITGV